MKRRVLCELSGATHYVPQILPFLIVAFPFLGNQERKLKKNVETYF